MRTEILNELETAWAGRTCLCFDTLDSTNNYAKLLAKQEPVHGTLIVADTQTSGRGRRGRVWQSVKGSTISLSLCLEPKLPTERAAGLTLVMALAAAEAINRSAGVKAHIKWPNDIVLNSKKICGILTEMNFVRGGYAVIVGVGINVNTEEFPEELEQIASSLRRETGNVFSRERLIASIMKWFEIYYEQYTQTGDMSLLRTGYEQLLINRGREVLVLDPKGAYSGVAKGITKEGNLVVVCADGTEKEIYSGEVSVRGLYGYV